jgi:hypothetical protein
MAAKVDLIFYRHGEEIKVGEITVNDDNTLEGRIWKGPLTDLGRIAATSGMVAFQISAVAARPRTTENDCISSYDPNSPVPEVDSEWIWEKGNFYAEGRIRVIKVKYTEGAWKVKTAPVGRFVTAQRIENESHWNDLSRFWEAVTKPDEVLYLAVTRIEVAVCGDCEHKAIAARNGTQGPLAVCVHLDDSVISSPGAIQIVSANTGEVLFTFDSPST